MSFSFYLPTKIYFGKDSENDIGKIVRDHGFHNIMIHFGGHSAVSSGLISRIERSLAENDISYTELGGVVPNPRLSKVYDGIKICKEKSIDMILAVGGGSVIDSSKAIAYGVEYDGDVWDIYTGKHDPVSALPVASIPTIAAAGSEMSNSSVLMKDDTKEKRGTNHEICRCIFSVLDPVLTYTLPAYQTASGCVDICMHSMERYFSEKKNLEITYSISESLIRTVMRDSKILMEEPDNYDARASVMWAASLSHNGLTGFGGDGGDWASHQMEHELSGMFDVAHGAGLAAIWGSWARYVMDADTDLFYEFAVNVAGSCENSDKIATCEDGIEKMETYFRNIGMPTSVHDIGIELTGDQIKEMSSRCSRNGKRTIGKIKKLSTEDIEEIFKIAR